MRRSELVAAGVTRRDLRSGLDTGAIIRVRNGWYGRSDLSPDQIAAARVGGRLSCLSWSRHRGLWIPPTADDLVHVTLATNVGVSARGVLAHFVAGAPVISRCSDRTLDDARSALDRVARCQPPAIAFVVIESALREGVLRFDEWVRIREGLPARRRILLSPASLLSGSGTESEFSFRARALGIGFRQQVWIGRDRVDFLLDDGRIVEIDSREFHDQLRDHERDARTRALGHETLRFSYDQVWFAWSTVVAALLG